MTTMEFSKWLENRFLEWQRKEGGRRTAGEFAEWLGFGNTTVNQWLNGRHVPTLANAQALSMRLGLEVYDALGLPRPDEGLYHIDVHWHILREEEKAKIKRVIDGAKKREGDGEEA